MTGNKETALASETAQSFTVHSADGRQLDLSGVTPMMKQYLETKQEYRDCILFYRLGDFYEMFFDDAVLVSRELELTLTGKDCGLSERAPMCGVPYHALDGYLNKLVGRGYKVAICEQVEDPRQAKGLVKRDVIRIATPGTNLDTNALAADRNNYLMSIVYTSDRYGISAADITTGAWFVTEVDNMRLLTDEITRYAPAEIICNKAFSLSGANLEDLADRLSISIFTLEDRYFDDETCRKALQDHFQPDVLEQLDPVQTGSGIIAAGTLLMYLMETQKSDLSNMTGLHPYMAGKFMLLDTAARRNLELCETLREKNKKGSLLWVLDKTKTAMGARMLRSFIEQPLIDKEEIELRQGAIAELNQNAIVREELREYLSPIYDLERLISRISYHSANPRDLVAFCSSLKMVPPIKTILSSSEAPLLVQLREELDTLEDMADLLERAIVEDPPLTIREGGFIKDGFHEEVDRLRRARTDGKGWLADIESAERDKTGIRNLKIKYNKVFGYYLEVTNSFKDKVPAYYTRKQTLTNAERYITPELKELEDTILGAEDKLYTLEYNLFCEIRDTVGDNLGRIQKTAQALAALDTLASLAFVAERNGYVRPVINQRGTIEIRDGRHPVVEQMMTDGLFIPNDTRLDGQKNRVAIITGPNMAGKSTYMRQTALIVLMAQIGSFVPASSAKIGLVDRIFTRVGASDDLASGQSTFMVEMTEVADILRNATKNSLLILDEIGRGTSTYDGLSIAWAVVEHISNPRLIGAKTLFATHYHELTELEGKISCVNNYCVAVKERGDDIVFLRKIVRGGADRSYGIQVAKLAGVPESVIERAKELLLELEENDITEKVQQIDTTSSKRPKTKKQDVVDNNQMALFDTVTDEDVLHELSELDVTTLTPIEAMNTLYRLQGRLKNRWQSQACNTEDA